MGIIGGADGPMSIFVATSGSIWQDMAVVAVAVLIGFVAGKVWKNRNRKG